MKTEKVWTRLAARDRRSVTALNRIAQEICSGTVGVEPILEALAHENAFIRGGAASVVERVSERCPERLAHFRGALLELAARTENSTLRWHLAEALPRLGLTRRERSAASEVFLEYLNDPKPLVKTCAMQALCELALIDRDRRPAIMPLLQHLTENGTAAMRARGRKLLVQTKKAGLVGPARNNRS